MVASTLTVTADVAVCTTNDAVYVPSVENAAGKLTVTEFWFTPVKGETVSQLAVGDEMDHFNAPLPALLIVTTCGGGRVPAYALTLTDVGVTARTACACADAGKGITSQAVKPTNKRTALVRIVIRKTSPQTLGCLG
jgi:hypothetical protein